MPDFKVKSEYSPSGDQPEAIAALSDGFREGLPEQVLRPGLLLQLHMLFRLQ